MSCFINNLPDDIFKSQLAPFLLPFEQFAFCRIAKIWNKVYNKSKHSVSNQLYVRDLNTLSTLAKHGKKAKELINTINFIFERKF